MITLVNQQTYHDNKFLNILVNNFSDLVVIQLSQDLSVTFEDVEMLCV